MNNLSKKSATYSVLSINVFFGGIFGKCPLREELCYYQPQSQLTDIAINIIIQTKMSGKNTECHTTQVVCVKYLPYLWACNM